METIFALATAQGKAGLAVVRISGPLSLDILARYCGSVPANGRGLRKIVDADGQMIDEALVLIFPNGKSFTGDDVVELHLHGSTAIVRTVLVLLSSDKDLRMAQPGEFTRRALESGRLDIAQVEGLADLIDAETESQRQQALRVFAGELGAKVEDWRRKLIRAAALIEATIDFVDEDVPVDVTPEVSGLVRSVMSDLSSEIAGVRIAERIRDGFEVAIVGAPNVGKSTLLNRLAGREAAITSEFAGTTRDVIEVRMDLDGLPVTVLDTAGIRETADEVEGIGIARGLERAALADLRVLLVDADAVTPDIVGPDDIVVVAKGDIQNGAGLSVSGKTGLGVDQLVEQIAGVLRNRAASVGIAMRERHRMAMASSLYHLEVVAQMFKSSDMLEDIVADELRAATRSIDTLVGRVDVEDLLDEIFSSFCIGK
jgi:tRNA modification GTPase